MKVLFLNTFSSLKGGAERVVLDTSIELVRRGHEVVVVFAYHDRQGTERQHWPWGIHRYYVPELVPDASDPDAFRASTSSDQFRLGMRHLQSILDIEAPDIVHVHNLPAVDLLEGVQIGAPMVRTIHSWDTVCESGTLRVAGRDACTERRGRACRTLCGYPNGFEFERRTAQNDFMMEAFERLLPVSGYVRDVLVRNGFDSSQLTVVGNFTRLFTGKDTSPDVPEGPVLAVGRMTSDKGFKELAAALSRTRARPSLRIVGTDNVLWTSGYRSAVMRTAHEAGIAIDSVDWCLGAVLENAYRSASIVAVPSMWPEPFGLVGIEAMMAGKAVVAFDSGGISDWLEDGVTGLRVRPGDVDAFARAVDRLMTDTGFRRRLAANARSRALSRFSADAYIPRLLEIYDEVIHESTAHRSRGRAALRYA